MSGGFDLLGALSRGSSPESPAEGTTTAGRPGAAPTPASAAHGSHDDPGPLPCSARGCSADAAYGLRWNNPRIHTPARRKTWLACPDHRDHLSAFLSDRGFLKETVAAADLPGLEHHAPSRRGAPEDTSRGGETE